MTTQNVTHTYFWRYGKYITDERGRVIFFVGKYPRGREPKCGLHYDVFDKSRGSLDKLYPIDFYRQTKMPNSAITAEVFYDWVK